MADAPGASHMVFCYLGPAATQRNEPTAIGEAFEKMK